VSSLCVVEVANGAWRRQIIGKQGGNEDLTRHAREKCEDRKVKIE